MISDRLRGLEPGDSVQLLLVRSQQLHHGTFCTASSPGTIHPAVHPSAPITFYIPDEIFDIFSLCVWLWRQTKHVIGKFLLLVQLQWQTLQAVPTFMQGTDGENISRKIL